MKKWLALLLALILIPTCSLAEKEILATGVDQFGNECYVCLFAFTHVLCHVVETESLPVTLPYGKKGCTVLSVDLYRTSSECEAPFFIHIMLDAKKLTEKEKEQLLSSVESELSLSTEVSFPILDSSESKKYFAFETSNKIINIISWHDSIDNFFLEQSGDPSEVVVNLTPNFAFNPFIVNSKEYNVDYSFVVYTSSNTSFRDLSDMKPKVYKQLKKILAEKGLELE